MKTKIYTLDYCPYCKRAISFFQENDIDFEQIRIDDNEEKHFEELKKNLKLKAR